MTLPSRQEIDGIIRRADHDAIRQARDQLRVGLRGQRVTAEQASSASEMLAKLSNALKSDADNSLPARLQRARNALAGDGDGEQEAARARARVWLEGMGR